MLFFLSLCFFYYFVGGRLSQQYQVSMAPLQPPANFKYKFFWGASIPENFNLASSSFSNVVYINHVHVRVPPIEVSKQKKHLKRKKYDVH
jgi:hypothetical protein